MSQQPTVETRQNRNKPAANGETHKAETPAMPVSAEAQPSAPEASESSQKRGARPTSPAVVVYELGEGKAKRTHAVVVCPVTGATYEKSGLGRGTSIGGLTDVGFVLSGIRADGPEWLVSRKLPDGARIVGYCTISGFPLPAQD